MTSLILGCLGLVLIVVVGPWVGCAACVCIGSAASERHAPTRPPGRH